MSISINKTNQLTLKVWLRALATPIFLFILIFPFAGRLDYWQGWLYIVINTLLVLMTVWIFRDKPEFIAERLKPGEGTFAVVRRTDERHYLDVQRLALRDLLQRLIDRIERSLRDI